MNKNIKKSSFKTVQFRNMLYKWMHFLVMIHLKDTILKYLTKTI